MDKLLAQVKQADARVAQLEEELARAKLDQRQAHQQALRAICPFADIPREQRFIPLSATQALVNVQLSMQPAHTPDGAPRWEARGKQVRFRMGVCEGVREGSIDQPAYEALSEAVRGLTREQMAKNTQAQALTGQHKALKLTVRQLSMFAGLASNNERRKFNIHGEPGGQRLPSAIWNSQSSTQEIWRALVKRGVLVIEQGDPEKPYSSWAVNPGPRFEEAVSLLLESDVFSRGSLAYEQVLREFRPGTSAPSKPPRRLR